MVIINIISASKFLKEGPKGNLEKPKEDKGNDNPHRSNKGRRSEEVTASNENKGNDNPHESSKGKRSDEDTESKENKGNARGVEKS